MVKKKIEKTKVTWYITKDSAQRLREMAQMKRRSAGMQASVLIDAAHRAMFPEMYADEAEFLPEGYTEEEFEVECSR